LYIYDAIFIRYNATEAENNIGAGQPLHRDLGYVSVNIMLNQQEEFQGGGTFFENQLLPVVLNDGRDDGSATTAAAALPLKPLGPGHAIAHKSSDRHAGSATVGGVRDILVLFVAVAAGSSGGAPAWEVNARLKSTARSSSSSDSLNSSIGDQLLRRVRHHRLAIRHVPNDGEAWHYLGMALLDYHNYHLQYKHQEDYTVVLRLSISCLETATIYTPCDGRLQNNLGIALERLYEFHLQTLGNDQNEDELTALRSRIATSYERSVQIHFLCNQIGCDVKADYESVCLNYGLYLSKLDDFENAIDILSLVATEDGDDEDERDDDSATMDASLAARRRVLRDTRNLLAFCRREQMKPNS
jgi:tetratricopeptide (TPR) repeat protein